MAEQEVKLEPMSLESLAAGAAGEMFDHELVKVLENIDDPNTEAKGNNILAAPKRGR